MGIILRFRIYDDIDDIYSGKAVYLWMVPQHTHVCIHDSQTKQKKNLCITVAFGFDWFEMGYSSYQHQLSITTT